MFVLHGASMDDERITPETLLAESGLADAAVPDVRVAGPGWHVRRLRAMSPGEVGARTTREFRHRLDVVEWRIARRLWRRRWTPPPLADDTFRRPRGFMTADKARALIEADADGASMIVARADAILAGDASTLGYAISVPQLAGRDLTRDPVTGYVWPDVHAKRVAFRDSPGSPKRVWEINRCQELPVLAGAFLISGNRRYEEAAVSWLSHWLEAQVPGRGVAWANGFEAGLRAISIAVAYDALAVSSDVANRLRTPVLGSLWQHARWIEMDPSTHSSANNHRVGELVGLLAVARLAPELPESERWTRAAVDGLRKEASAQILPDGAGAEQAFAYTLFVLDLLLVAVALLEATDHDTPSEILDALERAGGGLWAQIGRPGEHDLTYGDNDDGRAIRLDGVVGRGGRGVAASICARTGNAYARTVAGTLDPTANWLFGQQGRDRFRNAAPAERPGSMILENAGLAVLRRGGTRVTFDAGPLGYLSIAAHGHADALAVTLSVDGADLVVDPGSGTYFGRAAAIRNSFRGTGFHGTVLVDGQDQSSSGGPFLWTKHARSWFHSVDLKECVVIAEHDGYRGEAVPVRHLRAVVIRESGDVLVYECIRGEGEHTASIRWPLHRSLRATAVGSDEVIAWTREPPGLLLKTAATSSGTMSVAHGEREQLEGWSSPQLDELVPSPLVKWDVTFLERLDAVTLLSPIDRESPVADLRLDVDGSVVQIELATTGDAQTVRLELPRPE
jgi:Heparinase II/III-like protein/Heparinase II/III N-terminus